MKPFTITEPIDTDVTKLTAAERLVLWRYRQHATNGRLLGRSGAALTQSEAAARLGISGGTYARLEEGASSSMSADEISGLLAALGPLLPSRGELCFIARRRSGAKLQEVLDSFNRAPSESAEGEAISRPWFHQLERAGDQRVITHWESQGFKFP